jgi:hypothetical protein
MSATLPLLAGITSTVVFAVSTVPMLVKAGRTKDLSSYSLGNIVLVNVGNVVHTVYVFHLPVGPIWALHLFYLFSSALQLTWYLRFLPRTRAGPSVRAPRRRRRLDRSGDGLDDAQIAFGCISEDAQRSLVGRTLVRGDGLVDTVELDQGGSFEHAGLEDPGRIAAGEKVASRCPHRRSGKLDVCGKPGGITDRSECVDPVGLGHRSSTPFMVAGEPGRGNVAGLRYRRTPVSAHGERDSDPVRRDP